MLTPDEAREGLALLQAQLVPTPAADMGLHDIALDIGLAVSQSTYDTLYVAFALAVGATNIIVADGPFVKAMARHPDPALAGMLLSHLDCAEQRLQPARAPVCSIPHAAQTRWWVAYAATHHFP